MPIKKLPKLTPKKRFSFLQALYMSWYSGDFYFDVYESWRKHMALFLLAICLIIGLPIAKQVNDSLGNYVINDIIFPVNNMPRLIIENGTLTAPSNQQVFVKNSAGKVAIIIDTTNKIKSLPQNQYPEAFLLLNKTKWSILLSPNEWTQYLTYNSALKQKYDKRELEIIEHGSVIDESFFNKAVFLIKIGIIPSTTLVLFSLILTFIMFFSITSKFLATILFKFELTIKQSARIMLVSSIPTLWLIFILEILPIETKFYGLATLLLMPFYYNFAIYHIKKRLKIKTRGIIGRLLNLK